MIGKILKTRKINKEAYNFMLSRDNDYIVCYTPENCFGYSNVIMLSQPHLVSINGRISHRTRQAYGIHRAVTPWILKEIERVMLMLEREQGLAGGGYKHFTLSGEPLIMEDK